ncbi:MAG: hypothetical protein J6334_14175 [Kiritimatiellae bacterium]|nr:hypothetical protein [Kiritimatiellia bacterium]
MKCELCHEGDAQTVVWKVIDGERRELYVCHGCARKEKEGPQKQVKVTPFLIGGDKRGPTDDKLEKSIIDTITRHLDKLFKIDDAFPRHIPVGDTFFSFKDVWGREREVPKPEEKCCPKCRITSSEVRNGMRLGCPACYAAFADEIAPEIREAQRPLDSGGVYPLEPATDEERGAAIRDVALGCRIRLAANLAGSAFPDWASDQYREKLFNRIVQAFTEAIPNLVAYAVSSISDAQKRYLQEEHAVSPDLLSGGIGAGVLLLEGDPSFNVMVNEEDHIRYQIFGNGLDFKSAWERLSQLAQRVESRLRIATDETYGRLTACPSNVGTGIRASVMLHLPALGLLQELDPVIRGLERLRLLVRGGEGEGSAAEGSIFQLSNLDSLGMSPDALIGRVQHFARIVIDLERQARRRLLRDHPLVLHDALARSLAVLQNAKLISSTDACSLLSMLRLGVAMGVLRVNLDLSQIDQLMLAVKPAHFRQANSDGFKDEEERDARRAEYLNLLRGEIRMDPQPPVGRRGRGKKV